MKNICQTLLGVILIFMVTFWGLNQPVYAGNETNIDHSQPDLQQVLQDAFMATNQGEFIKAEGLWTQLIEAYPNEPALWSNRGNIRVSQNKLNDALRDYNQAIELAPNAPDPYLNRGTALEGLGRWQEAIDSYNEVLKIDSNDPAAYNNRGNAKAGLGEWDQAVKDYAKAFELAPDYAFAQANYALALYQIGETEKSLKMMKSLVRKYAKFADMRAALTAVLWENGQQGEAESHWVSAVGLDPRYQDLNWLKNTRRWPPKMVTALDHFLHLK